MINYYPGLQLSREEIGKAIDDVKGNLTEGWNYSGKKTIS
jgi:hypothetical protein